MGTRNVTVIRYNGEEKVRQYGQWDGYPMAALASIVKFLKTEGAIEHLKRNLNKCKLISEEQFVYPEKFEYIANSIYRCVPNLFQTSLVEQMEVCPKLFDVSYAEMFEYYLATRDTGYDIPNILITNAADEAKEIILQEAYTNKCDWQIEAVNIICLDSNRITSYWHNKKMTWDFGCLPDDEEIERFEQEEE